MTGIIILVSYQYIHIQICPNIETLRDCRGSLAPCCKILGSGWALGWYRASLQNSIYGIGSSQVK